MPVTATVAVATPSHRYEILIGKQLLAAPSTWAGLPQAAQAVLVSNPLVHAHYGAAVESALAAHYARVSRLLLPDGDSLYAVLGGVIVRNRKKQAGDGGPAKGGAA